MTMLSTYGPFVDHCKFDPFVDVPHFLFAVFRFELCANFWEFSYLARKRPLDRELDVRVSGGNGLNHHPVSRYCQRRSGTGRKHDRTAGLCEEVSLLPLSKRVELAEGVFVDDRDPLAHRLRSLRR